MFYEFTHTHHPHHGSCRDVTAARKAKASLNLEKTRSCLHVGYSACVGLCFIEPSIIGNMKLRTVYFLGT